MDSDNTPNLPTEQAAAAAEALEKTSAAAVKLADDMGVLNVSEEEANRILEANATKTDHAGKSTEEAGKKAKEAKEKQQALKEILAQLNEVTPGLGQAMELLSGAYAKAGKAAGDGKVGVAGFTVALREMVASMGPLLIASLSIEAAMKLWDAYKEKVEAAAKAHEEAAKKIQESTREALSVVQALDKALHPPEKNQASQDERTLNTQQQDLENATNRQKELNRASQDKELAGAGSEAEKEQINKRYEMLDKRVDDWRAKQKAAIESTMVGVMKKQLADIEKAENALIKKRHDADQSGDPAQSQKSIAELKTKKEEATALRDQLNDLAPQADDDTRNANFNAETNRQAYGIRGQKYTPPDAGFTSPGPNVAEDDVHNKFATGQSIAKMAKEHGGKVDEAQKEFLKVLEQTITGQKQTFEQAAYLIEQQSKNGEFTRKLLSNAATKVEQMSGRLAQLEAQMTNSSLNHN